MKTETQISELLEARVMRTAAAPGHFAPPAGESSFISSYSPHADACALTRRWIEQKKTKRYIIAQLRSDAFDAARRILSRPGTIHGEPFSYNLRDAVDALRMNVDEEGKFGWEDAAQVEECYNIAPGYLTRTEFKTLDRAIGYCRVILTAEGSL